MKNKNKEVNKKMNKNSKHFSVSKFASGIANQMHIECEQMQKR